MDRKPRAEGGPYIGRPMPRFEDLRLVRGAGRYSDDISMPGQAYAVFVRSPHAHAKVKTIDTSAAKKMPGVIAVLTGADYIADGLKGAVQRANPAGAVDIKQEHITGNSVAIGGGNDRKRPSHADGGGFVRMMPEDISG